MCHGHWPLLLLLRHGLLMVDRLLLWHCLTLVHWMLLKRLLGIRLRS